MKTYTHNWHVRNHKLKAPYNFALVEYGYWSRLKPTKRILKRCDCRLIVRFNKKNSEEVRRLYANERLGLVGAQW